MGVLEVGRLSLWHVSVWPVRALWPVIVVKRFLCEKISAVAQIEGAPESSRGDTNVRRQEAQCFIEGSAAKCGDVTDVSIDLRCIWRVPKASCFTREAVTLIFFNYRWNYRK